MHIISILTMFAFSILHASTMHPQFSWKDSSGINTTDPKSYSFEKSCNECHDVSYIMDHNSHAKVFKANSQLNCLTCHTEFSAPSSKNSQHISITRPTSQHCLQCHDNNSAFTMAKGMYFSSERISRSSFNIKGKDSTNQPWDIHAQKGLQCTDCHFSENNPVYFRYASDKKQQHLTFDPRKSNLSEYLSKPSHTLSFSSANKQDCRYCHTGEHKGRFQDRSNVHFTKLACQSCHTPALYSPVLKHLNKTVINNTGEFSAEFYNVDSADRISPFTPALLKSKRTNLFSPHTYSTSTYFYSMARAESVPDTVIKQVFKSNITDIQRYLDADKNGTLSDSELLNPSEIYIDFMKVKLLEKGYERVEVKRDEEYHPIGHNTVQGKYITKSCSECHSKNTFSSLSSEDEAGLPSFNTPNNSLYIFGKSSNRLVDTIGLFLVIGAFLGAFIHGMFRLITHLKAPHQPEPKMKKVYIYPTYERLWHWTQALVILTLLFSGIKIHNPDSITSISFESTISLHRILGIILGINAIFALFYNLSTGSIKQYIPAKEDFFTKAFEQQMFYLRGIFKKEPHPFHKHPDQRLNPLQQIAYLSILNILLPTLVVTGFIIFIYPYNNEWLIAFGGLEILSTIHTGAAWLISAFLIMHIYLTTTGRTPMQYTKAMITGWEDVEDHTTTSNQNSKEEH